MESQEQIEIRSEKVQNVIEQIPSVLTRGGTMVVVVILTIIGYIAYKVPYPFALEADGVIVATNTKQERKITSELTIPYKYHNCIHKKKSVTIIVEDQDDVKIISHIDSIRNNIVTRNGRNYFIAYAPIKTNDVMSYNLFPKMTIHAIIVIDSSTVLQRIFNQ